MKVLMIILWGACPTEDSTNCVWNAETQGNGEGQSFLAVDLPIVQTEVLFFLGS